VDSELLKNRKVILLGVILLALVISVIYNVGSSTKSDIQPENPTIFGQDMTWRCIECDHTITAQGGKGPKACEKCGKEAMYVCQDWGCLKHGVLHVWFKYDSKANPTEIKVGKGNWVNALDAEGDLCVKCPICDDFMVWASAMPVGQ